MNSHRNACSTRRCYCAAISAADNFPYGGAGLPWGHLSELGCSINQLALAWVAASPNTSTVILGASKPEQVLDNLKALEVIPKLTPEVLEKIEKILDNKPEPWVRLLGCMLFLLC